MLRFGRAAFIVVGLTVSLIALIWWVRFHRIPTLRISYTLGKGLDAQTDWLDLRRS